MYPDKNIEVIADIASGARKHLANIKGVLGKPFDIETEKSWIAFKTGLNDSLPDDPAQRMDLGFLPKMAYNRALQYHGYMSGKEHLNTMAWYCISDHKRQLDLLVDAVANYCMVYCAASGLFINSVGRRNSFSFIGMHRDMTYLIGEFYKQHVSLALELETTMPLDDFVSELAKETGTINDPNIDLFRRVFSRGQWQIYSTKQFSMVCTRFNNDVYEQMRDCVLGLADSLLRKGCRTEDQDVIDAVKFVHGIFIEMVAQMQPVELVA